MLYFFLVIPNLMLAVYTQQFYLFFFSLSILAYLYALLKTTKYYVIIFPFFLFIPCYAYYVFLYHAPPSEQILSIVLETNIQEALHFIGAKIYIYSGILLIWSLFCFYYCYKNFKNPIIWYHRSRYWILVVGSIYFSFSFFLQEVNYQAEDVRQENFLAQEKNTFLQDLKSTYPVGLFISFYDLLIEQQKIQQAFQINKKFKFHAQQKKNLANKEIYVLVIGETSRRANWELNGYQRSTNPLLRGQKNLVNFSNFLAISTATRSSIPIMLTRKPAEQVYQFNFNEKSIISAFKEAGFKTYWLSMQQQFGTFDTSTSVYAKEADHMMFFNHTDFKNAGLKDDILISELKNVIKTDENKKFIIIHTLGSHYNYAHRYPKEFDYFKPSLMSVSGYSLQNIKYKKELLNSYDNSILFTDYVLNSFIDILKKQELSVFMLYSSDHGESLFDKNCSQSGHGLRTKDNLEIASFIWYSDQYKKINLEKITMLTSNAKNKLNQKIIFPTLLDAANITISNDSFDRSILKEVKEYPRLVLGGVNYDTAPKEGECQEIR